MEIKLFGNQANEEMLAALKRSERFPHCIILSGGTGSGKKTFASHIAAAYFCEENGEGLFCGRCDHCRLVLSGNHPDLSKIQGGSESKTGGINVDQVRELKKESAVRANQASGRVFIIEDAHLMQDKAANALLKQIEEPISGVVYILLCEGEQLLKETIRSRGIVLRMPSLTSEEILAVLSRDFAGREEEIIRWSRLFHGGLGAVKAVLSDPEMMTIGESCLKIQGAFTDYRGYDLMRQLRAYEGKRAVYEKLLTTLRLFLLDGLKDQPIEEMARWVRGIDQLQWGIQYCRQNVVLSMLTAVLAAELTER